MRRSKSRARFNSSSKFFLPSSSLLLILCIFSSTSLLFFLLYQWAIPISFPPHHPIPDLRKVDEDQLWNAPSSRGFHACVDPSSKYEAPQDLDRYLTVRSNGGLNQMRTGIADMVAIARMVNATLVIPQLDKKSFWQDSSTFEDIFDQEYFISSLKGDIRVIKELPKGLEFTPRARKHFGSWSGRRYYEEIALMWKEYKVIHVPKSDSRLSNNDLPLDIQRLRCRAMYGALRFSHAIEYLGKKIVENLRSRGPYIALHLRYEKDMLAFTGCTYGLNDIEAAELTVLREKTSHWKVKNIDAREQRIEGNCPLTPKEVGMFLRALGYPSATPLYVAAGEIYGGSLHLEELRSSFPNLLFKETVVGPDELGTFSNHATQNAAIDYIVSIESDVFIPSYSGNMARAVEGHRRFLGHRKTISPDRKGLVEIFDRIKAGELEEGPLLSKLVKEMHKNRYGAPRRREGPLPGLKGRSKLRTEESFYENPYPECICKR